MWRFISARVLVLPFHALAYCTRFIGDLKEIIRASLASHKNPVIFS